jgi:copper resistance protein C
VWPELHEAFSPRLVKGNAMSPGHRIRHAFLVVAAVVFLLNVGYCFAHAVLLESSPALKSSVAGPDVSLRLRFNVRIDAARSRLTLVDLYGSSQTLEIDKQDPPNTLSAQAKGLRPGAYRLRWQVLASDGHITRGEIPFTVVNP